MYNLLFLIVSILVVCMLYYQDSHFFYKIEQKYCERFQGNCKKCNCWSCKRKSYIDEYMEGKNG